MSIPLEEPFPLSGGMQILAGAKIVEAGGGRARQFFILAPVYVQPKCRKSSYM